MNANQEPKYRIEIRSSDPLLVQALSEEPRIVNRQSGEAIPDDEPIFILRARDVLAVPLLKEYFALVYGQCGDSHITAVRKRLAQFAKWQEENPGRVKKPDTELTREWDNL
jgi:hypothetical protein